MWLRIEACYFYYTGNTAFSIGDKKVNCNQIIWNDATQIPNSTPKLLFLLLPLSTSYVVRNFSQVRFHTFNSLDYVALFRRALIQFSTGGQLYDRRVLPVVADVPRDTRSHQPRWLSFPLDERVGRFVRVTLWFDYDWIVLSEVTFESGR